MPTTIFKLKEPKSEVPTLINMFFNFNYYELTKEETKKYIPLKYSTGEKILPKFWKDNPIYRAKETRAFPEYPEFNHRLNILEATLNTVYRRLLNDDKPITPDKLRLELNIVLGKDIRKDNLSLLKFIEEFIKEVKSTKRPNTIKKYNETLTHLINYGKKKKVNIDFETIDLNFYYGFVDYLTIDLDYSPNTIGKHIKTLKVFLSEATERGINKTFAFKSRKFKAPYENVDKIYLTDKELLKIYNLNLSDNQKLERVRDLFILECYLGLRFSDIEQLGHGNIQQISDKTAIKIKTKKTGETVIIPLHWIALEILDKYQNNLPRVISNQKTNEYLKVIGKKAKINHEVEVVKTKGGKEVRNTIKKHDLISTHVSRRSFASNTYLAGIPAISIMKITGHRTERAFLQYIRISQEENVKLLMKHPYFNTKPTKN